MNISQHVERAAKFFPDRAAIMFEGATWTYVDLNTRANRLANALKAAIVLKEGATAPPEEIIEFCRANMAVYKAPAYVDFIKDLPRNPTGKILKRVLKGQ